MHQNWNDVSELVPYFFVGNTNHNFILASHDVDHQWLTIIARKIALWLATFDILEICLGMDAIDHFQVINF